MKVTNKKLVVVLGMHRSGTSAITRGLQTMNVVLGDRMMPRVLDINPKGFWEDIDLNALNIELLRAVDSDWQHLAAIDKVDVDVLRKRGYFLRAVELLRQKVHHAPVFGFKDPRVAKLLPFWKDVFCYCRLDVNFVVIVRHPLSVAKSLAKRDGFEAAQSYLLWLGHVITSLTGSVGDRRVLVDYDRFMQSPERELNRIAKHLELEIDPKELQCYLADFLDQSLRHTVFDPSDLLLDDSCSPTVREVYAALLDVASEKTKFQDVGFKKKVMRWAEEFERLQSPLRLVDTLLAHKTTAKQAVAEREEHISIQSNLRKVIAERENETAGLAQAMVEREGNSADLSRKLADSESHVLDLTHTLVARDNQLASVSPKLIDYENQIAMLTQALAERDDRVAGLNQTLVEREHATLTLTQAITERDCQIVSLDDALVIGRNQINLLSQNLAECEGRILRLTLELEIEQNAHPRLGRDGVRRKYLSLSKPNDALQSLEHFLREHFPA